MSVRKHASMAVVSFVAALVFLYAAIDNGTTAAEPSDSPKGSRKATDRQVMGFPKTAFEYAKMVEPELGVPPRIDLGQGVEIPLYVDGVRATGHLGHSCDNPSRLGKGCISGSVLQRHEGRTADGKPLPDVVWVSFGRNSSFTHNGSVRVFGSVQMIGYHEKTGATAFFESSDNIKPWASVDPETERLLGVMPWIDEPEEFNRAYRTPGKVQCVECHQNDPFIHNSFIDAAKMPGTDETVVPKLELDGDSPYYVIGGDHWDMRTMHIEGNGCFECHRVGVGTLKLFMRYGWDPNENMPPHDPGSLADDLQELLDAWERGPENTPGANWVVPPARGEDRRVVGDDYPYKAVFNEPGNEALAFSKEKAAKDGAKSADSSLEQLGQKLKQAVSDGKMTEEEAMAAYEKAVKTKGKGKAIGSDSPRSIYDTKPRQ